jgi:hypothetical protein
VGQVSKLAGTDKLKTLPTYKDPAMTSRGLFILLATVFGTSVAH